MTRLSDIRERCERATKGPLTYEKRESVRQGSWHYAIKTTYNHPEHPWSPRFVAWMCGGLGEATPSHRTPDDVRSDPAIEADADFFAHSREDVPWLLAEVTRLQNALRKIANPIEALRQEAEEKGMSLDGYWAVELSESANYLKQIAQDALEEKQP